MAPSTGVWFFLHTTGMLTVNILYMEAVFSIYNWLHCAFNLRIIIHITYLHQLFLGRVSQSFKFSKILFFLILLISYLLQSILRE